MTGTYVSNIVEAENSPLTWQHERFPDVESPGTLQMMKMKEFTGKSKHLEKKKTQVIYVSSDSTTDRRGSIHNSNLCRPKRRPPHYLIIVIALLFLLLLLSAVAACLYFAVFRREPIIDVGPTVITPTISLMTSSTTSEMTTGLLEVTETTKQETDVQSTASTLLPTSLSTRIIEHSTQTSTFAITTEVLSPTEPSSTTLAPTTVTSHCPDTTTNVENTPDNIPIFYISGPFTYEGAREACREEGTLLALRDDIIKAADAGYNRCLHGWLRDMHIAMIMQPRYASVDCEGGRTGAIYKAAREPDDKYSGAYCVKDPETVPSLEELGVGSNPAKTINWWVTTDPMDAYDLRHVLTSATGDYVTKYPLMTSLKSVYTCCNSFNITYTDEQVAYVKVRYSMSYLRKVVEIYRRELGPVRVLAHVSAKYDAMIRHGAATNNRADIIAQLVNLATSAGLDGIIFDYEPKEEYTRDHAEIYRIFLNELSLAMQSNNMAVGTVISSWGILKYYDVFNNTDVDFLGSMSSTYYGHNIDKNKGSVTEMLNNIDHERLEIGLGLMHKSDLLPNPKRNYRWEEESLEEFVSWFDAEGVKRIHVYPGTWREHKKAANYFLDILAKFSED